MKALIQRVKQAEVKVDNQSIGKINRGILVLLGIKEEDSETDIDFIVDKITNLRIFENEGNMAIGR